jgi:hypothetical protein
MSIIIETRKTQNHLLISIPTDEISAEEIEEFISSLKTEFILRKSKMSEDKAEMISEEIKSDWWKKNGSRIKKMIDENE